MSIFVDSGLDQTDPLFVLVQTIVKVTEIVYTRDNKRCPRQCLQFYNCAFLHQQLYIDLFAPNMLSIYCHALFFHGPVQHEYVCSRSVNTEAEERLFKQANSAAKNTDHKIQNIVEGLLTRLQCKQIDSTTNSYCLTSSDSSRIKKATDGLPKYPGSVFTKIFIQSHIGEFQTHLQRISPFLSVGMGIWWSKDSQGNVTFNDSDNDPTSHPEGPDILHFRCSSYSDVTERARQCWIIIQQCNIGIPLRAIRSIGNNGNVVVDTPLQEPPIDEVLGMDISNEAVDSSTSMSFSPTVASTPKRQNEVQKPLSLNNVYPTESENTSIDTRLDESTVDDTDISELKTTLAKAIAKVLGNNEDIRQFDTIRYSAKQKKTPGTIEAQTHKTMVKAFRKQIVHKMHVIKSQMKAIERGKDHQTHTDMYKALEKELHRVTKIFSNLRSQ